MLCGGCGRSFLAAAIASQGTLVCADCGSLAKPIPGPSYVREDSELFEHLWHTLSDAALSQAAAARLRGLLEEPLPAKATNLQRVNRLASVLPSLALVDAMIDADTPALRKAEGMLTTMLDVLSLGH
jgi:hypothetical protein